MKKKKKRERNRETINERERICEEIELEDENKMEGLEDNVEKTQRKKEGILRERDWDRDIERGIERKKHRIGPGLPRDLSFSVRAHVRSIRAECERGS